MPRTAGRRGGRSHITAKREVSGVPFEAARAFLLLSFAVAVLGAVLWPVTACQSGGIYNLWLETELFHSLYEGGTGLAGLVSYWLLLR